MDNIAMNLELFQNVNDYVHTQSHGEIEAICTYSIMDRPMTSCGCFEVICGYVPECNGVMVVNREFPGDTPVGMNFSTLAGEVGGGRQTPGFMGCGKIFLTSRKFLLRAVKLGFDQVYEKVVIRPFTWPPLVWFTELGYWVVAKNRPLFGKFLFTQEK